jgi:hypothetical protein
MTDLPSYVYPVKRLVMANTAPWCKIKYPGHRHGCPNYDSPKHPECPPRAPKVEKFFNLDRPLYLVHSEFNLEAWAARMQGKHIFMSDRQARCCLYWQRQSRTELKDRIWMASVWKKAASLPRISTCPEGMGVNVYVTARLAGLKLEKIDGLNTCRHVALIQFYEETR